MKVKSKRLHRVASKRTQLVLTLLLVVAVVLLGLRYIVPKTTLKDLFSTEASSITDSSAEVSSSNEYRPQLTIQGGDDSTGLGVIALASTDEPTITISASNDSLNGPATVALYEATQEQLLTYLVHDTDNKQIKGSVDVGAMKHVADLPYTITDDSNSPEKLALPLSESGLWVTAITAGNKTEYAFIVRSSFGVVAKEGDNEHIFWAQSFQSHRSVTGGSLKIYSLEQQVKEIAKAEFGSDGTTKSPLATDADVAIVASNGSLALLPLNQSNLYDGGYQSFKPKSRQSQYFIFTDRPIYKPGDTVYFKAVLRDDDDARYTIPSGQASVKWYSGYGEEDIVHEQKLQISPDGTVSGEYDLPASAIARDYHLTVEAVGSTKSSTYFQVSYYRKPECSITVDSAATELTTGDRSTFTIKGSYFSGQPLAGKKVRYAILSGEFGNQEYLPERTNDLMSEYRYGGWNTGAVREGDVLLDKNGQAVVSFTAEPGKERGHNHVYSIEAEFDNGSGNPAFSRKNVLIYAGNFDVYRTEGQSYVQVGTPLSMPIVLKGRNNAAVSEIQLTAKIHRTNWVPFQEPDKKYPSYRKEEEDLAPIKATTDASGNVTLSFIPKKVGSYTLSVEGYDERNNGIAKDFFGYATTEEVGLYSNYQNNNLTITAEKEQYRPGETAKVSIASLIPNRDVLLSLERGRVNRFQIVHLNGKSQMVDLPLIGTDMPNIFADVSSFSAYDLDRNSLKLSVSPADKQLTVKVTANQAMYKPGDEISIDIETSDTAGKPQSADVALWTVDKALYEIVGDSTGSIFDAFWGERGDDTEHAHSLQGISSGGAEKGGGGGDDRTVFEDTAYWNPSIHTDASGKAHIAFKLPDNLTTWVLAAVANTKDTQVGQTTAEITVAKDIVVRPLLPNILREGDEAVLTAYLENFTDGEKTFTTDLAFDGGTTKPLGSQLVTVEAKGSALLAWKVLAQTVKDKASLVFLAVPKGDLDGDTITQQIPIKAFGYHQQQVQTGEGSKTFDIALAPDASKDQTTVTLSLAPSLFGVLPTAVDYLVSYPYGCAEQTTSQLVATLIAKQDPSLFSDALSKLDVVKVTNQQLQHIAELQHSDGGWSWWISGNSDPYISVYVAENVLRAKQAGVTVNQRLLDDAKEYFVRLEEKTPEDTVLRRYALTLLDPSTHQEPISNIGDLRPDLLALAVMANHASGSTAGRAQLEALAQSQGDGAFWEGGAKQQFGSVDASTALAIRALQVSGGSSELQAKAMRYLARNRQSTYWSNTYATAQVARTLDEYANANNEASPKYGYTISLDGKQIASGTVNDAHQKLDNITIPVAALKESGSQITLTQAGTGGFYSTLTADEFHTDRSAPSKENGLKVDRQYSSSSGTGSTIRVGDEVTVNITVSGLKTEEYYGAIVDELPAGLIPVSSRFNNEQYGDDSSSYYTNEDVSDESLTENGIVLSLYKMPKGKKTFTYQARAVTEGTFSAPPATATLMYAPEIFGRSAAQSLKVQPASGTVIFGELSRMGLLIPFVILLGIFAGVGLQYARSRRRGPYQTFGSER